MMTQRNCGLGLIAGDRIARVLLLVAAAALGGCQTTGTSQTSQTTEIQDNQFAASPDNIASLTAVIQRNPNDPQAYNMRGSVFGQSGRNDDALADFNKAISLDPNYAQAYANRGLIYRKTGKLDPALADYNKALQLDQNYAVAYLGRGIVHRQKKQALDAFNDFNKAIAIRPDNAQVYYNRGLLYQSQRQHQYAIDDFTTALGPVAERGRALRRARPELHGDQRFQVGGERPRQRGVGRAAEPAGLDHPRLAYEKLGDKERAAGSYARALNINRNHEAAKQGFARVGGKLGQSYQTF